MSDESKRNRTTAKARFTRYGNSLKKCISDNERLEIVDEQYSDFLSAWKNVENKHDEYIAQLQDADGDAWIGEVLSSYNETRTLYVEYKRKTEYDHNINLAFNLRNVFEKNFKEQVSNLENSINKNYHKETILRERSLVSKTFEELLSAHNKLTVLKITDEDKSLEMWYGKIHTDFGRVNKLIDDFLRVKPVLQHPERPKAASILLEKIPLPKFDGNIRNYPRFIKDFKELVMPNLKSAEAPFTLRQCLFESVQSGLSACDDNLEDMLSRLDEKYANPSKLVDCVVFEIQKFRKIDLDDNRRIIAFVDVIDRGYRDLKKLNLEQELCNSHVLGIIECKLPKNLQSEWYRMIHKEKIKISEKFVKLLDFLKIERSALEYGMSELRAYYERKPGHIHSLQGASSHSLSDACLIHDEAHRTENCKTYLTMTISDRYELLKRYFACFCCLTPDHRVEFCPQKRECGGGCSKFHHPSLHPPFHQAANNCCSVKNTCLENHDTNVILPIMKINYKNDKFINVLWDTAANLSLITKQKARDMKLHGKPVELSITVAGGERNKIDSEIYNVPIIDENGNKKHVLAYGIDKITNKISSFDGSKIIKLFPEIGIESISRPSGEVDLLIGYEYAGWHPTKELSHGHLLILRNQFGRCFGGNHPSIQEGTQRVVNIHELCHPQLKELQEKCAELEKSTADQNDFIKEQMIIDLKVKIESCESEMEHLNDEVERLKGMDEESTNMKSTLELKCQLYEEEIRNLKNEYGNHGRLGMTSDKLLDDKQLEEKYEELYECNQKLLQDYKGLEGTNNLRQKEIVEERRRDQRLINDLMEEKVKLLEHHVKNEKYDKSTETTALMKINKLKSENKLLREKLASIRNESEVNNSPASNDNTSPRYKPPMLPSYDNENEIRSGVLKSYPQPSRHEHMNGEDYTLPSRYNANRYSKSPESPPKSNSYEIRIDSILNRYSSPLSPRENLDSSTRISRPTSRHDSSLYREVSQTYPGVDSKVRRVTVQYTLPNHHTFTNIERSV